MAILEGIVDINNAANVSKDCRGSCSLAAIVNGREDLVGGGGGEKAGETERKKTRKELHHYCNQSDLQAKEPERKERAEVRRENRKENERRGWWESRKGS